MSASKPCEAEAESVFEKNSEVVSRATGKVQLFFVPVSMV